MNLHTPSRPRTGPGRPSGSAPLLVTLVLALGAVGLSGSTAYAEETPAPTPTCATTHEPSVTIVNPSVVMGDVLRVTGKGWCHPTDGGSRIAFKIDEGKYSHLTAELHANKTIWALADADPETGEFDTTIRLPNGSTEGPNGSDPAFPEGAHTLRLLTGSLKKGDTSRTVQSGAFTIGAYRPHGIPAPLEFNEELTPGARHGVTVARSTTNIVVRIPRAKQDDWVFLSAYDADGSPRYPWGDTWFRADGSGRVTASLSGATLPVGPLKLVAQSGNKDEVGTLLGWAPLAGAPASVLAPKGEESKPGVKKKTKKKRSASSTTASGTTSVSAPAVVTPGVAPTPPPGAPTHVPAAPFPDETGLTPANAGKVKGAQTGTLVTITPRPARAGDWVYLYAYSTPTPVGWIQVNKNRQVTVDVALLAAGEHKLAVLGRGGKLLGWTSATVTAAEAEAAPQEPTKEATASIGDAAGDGGGLSGTDWVLIVVGLVGLLAAGGGVLVARRRRQTPQGAVL